MGDLIPLRSELEEHPRTCWDCSYSTSGVRGTYCHNFNEWIFCEEDAASDCEGFDQT